MLTGVKGLYANTVAMAYDAGGRKASESLTIAGQTYTTETAYDTAGRVSQLTYPDGSVVARTYDSRNLLSTISLAGTNIDSRSYDTGGRLTSETLGNGLVVTRTYQTGDNLPLAISNSVVGAYTYVWDANKNKTGETITGAMANYTSSMGFDDQNRLTSWNRSNGNSQAWALSAVNDWQSITNNGTVVARTHGPTHEVLTVGTATITHDSRGNMTSDEFAIARTFDVDNKVIQAVVPSGSARGIVGTHGYQYDVLGRRVRKTIGGASPSDTVFSLAGEQIVADYPAGTAPASPTTKYVWGSYIDELVCLATSSTKLYPQRNQQYSTAALTDASGSVVERYAYTSYGDLLALDPAGTTVRTTPPQTRYTYTGREFDHETGAYHFRARPYSATLGRFTGHDPILYPDGYNTFAGWFGCNSTDASGLITKAQCQELLDQMMKSPAVTVLTDELTKGGCPLPKATCEECEGRGEIQGGNIQVCVASFDGMDGILLSMKMLTTVRHELVHALDMCNGAPTPDKASCAQGMCMEMRAVSCGGQCDYDKTGMNYDTKANRLTCIVKYMRAQILDLIEGKVCPEMTPAQIDAQILKLAGTNDCFCRDSCKYKLPPTPWPKELK